MLPAYAYTQVHFHSLWGTIVLFVSAGSILSLKTVARLAGSGAAMGLSWRCHYTLCWRYTLALDLECLWAHGTICGFSWSTLPLFGFLDRALSYNFALVGSLTSQDNFFL